MRSVKVIHTQESENYAKLHQSKIDEEVAKMAKCGAIVIGASTAFGTYSREYLTIATTIVFEESKKLDSVFEEC